MPEKKKDELNEGEMQKASGGGAKYSVSSQQTSARSSTGDNMGEEIEPGGPEGNDRNDRRGLGGSVRT